MDRKKAAHTDFLLNGPNKNEINKKSQKEIRMTVHLTVDDRWHIVSLSVDQGMSASRIVDVINCGRRTGYNILTLFCETNYVIERQGRGRQCLK
ncbi:unnamed protein product [Didymodactylos carnosus]|uniref:Uncharacterized protein n=1 Tax=Didymodactylos carnosus TaxID=1234261 RepID=A0A8S2FSJ1_9BILA|nr:unnamed protein product [Didymodactylos carnosus]CAF4323656.1 unnamed protein product [Didymodactylos carnosus]